MARADLPGVLRIVRERLIRQARNEGLSLAIATTTSLPNVHSLLEINLGNGSVEWFQAICTAEDVSRKKPDPEVYQIALNRLGLDARECLAFEDSRNGLYSAIAINIPTLVTPGIYTDDQEFPEAFAVMSDLGEPDNPGYHIAGRKLGAGIVDVHALHNAFA